MVKFADYRFLKLEIKYFKQYINNIERTEQEICCGNSEETQQLRKCLWFNKAYYQRQIKANTEQIQAIEGVINTLPEPYITIMRKRFMEGQKLEKIADEVYLDRTSVSRYINKIIKKLEVEANARFEQTN